MESTTKFDLAPKFGERLANNAVVISYTHQWGGGEGMLPYGVVLAYTGGGYHPYVTWRIALDSRDNLWYADSGHYFDNIVEAAADYKERGGK